MVASSRSYGGLTTNKQLLLTRSNSSPTSGLTRQSTETATSSVTSLSEEREQVVVAATSTLQKLEQKCLLLFAIHLLHPPKQEPKCRPLIWASGKLPKLSLKFLQHSPDDLLLQKPEQKCLLLLKRRCLIHRPFSRKHVDENAYGKRGEGTPERIPLAPLLRSCGLDRRAFLGVADRVLVSLEVRLVTLDALLDGVAVGDVG